MPVSGELSVSDVVVAPGDEEVVSLRVRNTGTAPASYSVVTTGLVQGWTIVDPPSLELRARGEQKVQIALRPPKLWSVPAGPSPLTVRIVPHAADDEVSLVEGTVSVLAFDDRRLSLAHAVERGRRRAEFAVVLENLGNARAACRLAVTDSSTRVAGRFDPPSMGVDPGDSGSARLIVRARRANWTRRARSLPFEVHALQEGHRQVSASGTLLQDPVLSGRALGRVVAATAIAVAGLLVWNGVVRPAIDDAAERAVAEQVVTTAPVDPAAPTLAPTRPDGAAPSGEAFDTRLAVNAPLAGQALQSYTVPAGKVLRVTDVLWQNPNLDEGRLELLRNSTPLYGISLRNFTDFSNALVSPFVFSEGEVVSAQLTCERIGNPSSDVCAVAITITGELVDR